MGKLVEFRLPDLGEGITEVEIVRWLVKPGDTVVQDQAVVSVQSDKAIVELPAPVDGTIVDLHVSEGQLVPVETILFSLQEQSQEATLPMSKHISAYEQDGAQRVRATPVARRMARELGIDINVVHGTGPSGRVRTEDVQKFIAKQQTDQIEHLQPDREQYELTFQDTELIKPLLNHRTIAPTSRISSPDVGGASEYSSRANMSELIANSAEEHIPLRGLRRRIAENMLLSVQTIPQVTAQIEVDASGLVALRQQALPVAEEQGSKLSYLPFIIKALIQALRLYPYVNASIDHERQEIILKHAYHIGIATATPDGLLVPVIRHADRLTLLELAAEIQRLAEVARNQKLQPHELRGSTFTISNYGSTGGFFTTPLINPGEAGILGLGRITRRPWVVDDHLEVRPVLPLSFTADHRLIDGELAMRFLNSLIALLEHPQRLIMYLR